MTQAQADILNSIAKDMDGIRVPGTELEPELRGCTDRNAANYNPNANVDDGSCQYIADPTTGD